MQECKKVKLELNLNYITISLTITLNICAVQWSKITSTRQLLHTDFFPAGTALVVVYFILLALYYYAPSPAGC